jgi:hypothetical protein
VRALTDSEARVLAVLLSARADRERERLKAAQVPRSTYHAVRRRAYEEGWLRDRYVPHPVPIGRPVVAFFLVRPYADRSEELLRALEAQAGTVVLWNGSQVVLAVLFLTKPAEASRLATKLATDRLCPPPVVVATPVSGPSVPVYFDFEGLWCNLAGLAGTLAYPHGLGGGIETDPEANGSATPSSHQWWAISELVLRPFALATPQRGGHLVGPFGLPFSQRKILQRGWVVHRTILDPSRLPAYQGRAADQVVLITGTPRSGARPDQLFATLTRESRVFPFLFAVAPDRWILGALGGSAPPPPELQRVRRPVLPTLREYLEGIEIVQEPAAGFRTTVDHRYDRLLPPGPSRPSSGSMGAGSVAGSADDGIRPSGSA